MPWTSEHLKWLSKTSENLTTSDGKIIEIWEFSPQQDDAVLSAWAKHFRNHYCSDSTIDDLRRGTGRSRSEYLNQIKFPDASSAPGPSIRAGDFGEILVADYLEYILGYWVPRTHYGNKTIRNESEKGCDIVGFKMLNKRKASSKDELYTFEAKTKFTGGGTNHRLQDAVDGSSKDYLRLGESLNAIKQRFYDHGQLDSVAIIERFQNPEDQPYREKYGAAALFSTASFDSSILTQTTTKLHPKAGALSLIVIRGDDLMRLVHKLYARAADEA